MSLIVRGGGTKLVSLKSAVTFLASSMDMAFWHAGARRPRTIASARLVHEIGRVRRSTMAGLRLIDAREGRFLHRTLGQSDLPVNNRCGNGCANATSAARASQLRVSSQAFSPCKKVTATRSSLVREIDGA